jgi:anti-anti-sigma factor
MSIHAVQDEHWAAPEVEACDGRLTASISRSVHGPRTWTIVRVAGDVDVQALALFRRLVNADTRLLVLDLRRVTFLDACGLDLLLRTQREALHADGCLRLVAPSRQVSRLLTLTGMDGQLPTFATLDEAVAAPASGPSP